MSLWAPASAGATVLVIPAKAGIQWMSDEPLGPGLRRGDERVTGVTRRYDDDGTGMTVLAPRCCCSPDEQ